MYGQSLPVTATTAGPRHTRVSYNSSPAGRSSSCMGFESPHQKGWHICQCNLLFDPDTARLSLLPPAS